MLITGDTSLELSKIQLQPNPLSCGSGKAEKLAMLWIVVGSPSPSSSILPFVKPKLFHETFLWDCGADLGDLVVLGQGTSKELCHQKNNMIQSFFTP
jgi:hypothetical protein